MDPLTKPEWRAGVNQVLSPMWRVGEGTPSGLTAPIGATWRQTDANATYGNLTGLLWTKVGTGTTEGTDWLVDFEGRWIDYTPTLTASTTNPTNWTQTGYYTLSGKTAHAKFALTAGGSMTAGSGYYQVALPATAASDYPSRTPIGVVILYDSSTSNTGLVWPQLNASKSYARLNYTSTAPFGGWTATSNTVPWTWAASDEINGTLTYEVA